MSFSDSPKIDKYAIYSEKSERRLKDSLNLASGFNVRTEHPDTGCDFSVELITDMNDAASWLFPIQIKSIEKLDLVLDNKFISLPFETSRMLYMMKRLPAMGLIVFYAVEEDRCCFEYVDKVYERIMEERNGSHDWKANAKVNIHIPYNNTLTDSAAKEIHQVLSARFRQAGVLQNSHGQKYGLPTYSVSGNFEYDFKNPDHIKIFLKEHGMMLINNYDVSMVFKMISQLPNMDIYGSKDLLFLAGLAYEESGLYSDAQVFCAKLRKMSLDDKEQLVFDFLALKNALALGYISHEVFLEKLQKLETKEAGTSNEMILRLNIIKYQLLEVKAPTRIPERLKNTVLALFDEIKASNLPDKTKTVLTLINCDNFSQFINHETGLTLGEYQMRKIMGNLPSKEQRQKDAMTALQMEMTLNNIVQGIVKKEGKDGDTAIKAHALTVSVFHFIQQQVNLISFEIPPVEGIKEILGNHISYAGTAYTYFMKLNSFKEAFDSLCYMLELVELGEQHYGITDESNKTQLYAAKAKMETLFDFPIRELIIPKLIAKSNAQKVAPAENGMPLFKDFTDDQIHSFAVQAHSVMNLPASSLAHLENELLAYRTFHQGCHDPSIEIHQYQQPTPSPHSYSRPIQFILRNKNSGIQTPPSSNIDDLLTAWGL